MRAVVIHAAHDLRVQKWPEPALGVGQVRVAIKAGGICGSDLHCYHNGGFGTVRVREPMPLAHEIAGVVAEAGASVSHFAPGMRVATSPSQPCDRCRCCVGGIRSGPVRL